MGNSQNPIIFVFHVDNAFQGCVYASVEFNN